MIDFSAAYPNSTKVFEERQAQLTSAGPAVTVQVPMRQVALGGGGFLTTTAPFGPEQPAR